MSFQDFNSLFGNSKQKDDIMRKKEARRKAAKVDDDPYAFQRPDKPHKKISSVKSEPIVEVEVPRIRDEGKVANVESVIYYENGKEIKPEDAFKGAGYAVFIASLFRMYHDHVGYENSDLIKFTTIISEAIRLYGPDIKVSDQVVGACSYHMEVSEKSSYQALREAKISIKDNVPRTVFADMIVSGDTGMTVDTVTGNVVVSGDVGLSKTATKAMGALFQTKTSPKEEMVAIVCDLTKTVVDMVDDLEDEVKRWIDESDVPDINETQPFKSLTGVPGLISSAPVAPGNQGLYQNMCKFIRAVDRTVPDVVIVPGNNQAMSGSYSSLGDCSRCIPLPDDLRQASPLLASINVPDFDQVIIGLRSAEITVESTPELKSDHNVNARSYYHSQFKDQYDKYRAISHGQTLTGLKYVTLYHSKPLTAQELYTEWIDGELDDNPVIMRASEYYLATMKGVKGSFVITDLTAMVGLFMTQNYVERYVNPKFVGEYSKMKPVTGFYVIRDFKHGSVTVYSSWIQKYTLAKLLDILYPGKNYGINIIKEYIAYAPSGKGKNKNAKTVENTLSSLAKCYGSMSVSPEQILVLVPNYSMKKTLKYTRMMLDDELLEKLADEAKGVGGGRHNAGEQEVDESSEDQQSASGESSYDDEPDDQDAVIDLEDVNSLQGESPFDFFNDEMETHHDQDPDAV